MEDDDANLPTGVMASFEGTAPEGASLSGELNSLNTEMESIQRQYMEMIKKHHQETRLIELSQDWLDREQAFKTQKCPLLSSPARAPFKSPNLNIERRYKDLPAFGPTPCRLHKGFPHTLHKVPHTNDQPLPNFVFSRINISPPLCQHPFLSSDSLKADNNGIFPKNLNSFSNFHTKNVRKLLPRMGVVFDSNSRKKISTMENNKNSSTDNPEILRHTFQNIQLGEKNGFSIDEKSNSCENGNFKNQYLENPENVYCTLQNQDLNSHYETLQFEEDRKIGRLKVKNLFQNKPYCNVNVNLYHVLEPYQRNEKDEFQRNKRLESNRHYQNCFKNQNENLKKSFEKRGSHSDVDHSDCIENSLPGLREWNSDGDKEDDLVIKQDELSIGREGERLCLNQKRSRNNSKVSVKRHLKFRKHQLSKGAGDSSFIEILVDGFSVAGDVEGNAVKPLDLVSGDPFEPPDPLMTPQTTLYKHHQKVTYAPQCHTKDRRLHGSAKPKVEGLKMEWVVKKKADGSRYITRRPVRSRLLKERARQVAEERCGVTSDDESMGEGRAARHCSKEDRKHQLEEAKEQKRLRTGTQLYRSSNAQQQASLNRSNLCTEKLKQQQQQQQQ